MPREPPPKRRRIPDFFTKVHGFQETPVKTSPEPETIASEPQPPTPESSTSSTATVPLHELQVVKQLPGNRYIPENFESLPKRKFGALNLRPQLKWFNDYNFIHYVMERDVIVCHTCIKTLQARKFPASLKIETCFTDITVGFKNWKKATEKFRIHKESKQHRIATEAMMVSSQQATIDSELIAANRDLQQKWQIFLAKVITSLKFLGEMSLPIRGHTANSGVLFELLRLRSHDDPILREFMSGKRLEYLSPDIQNELIRLLAHNIQRTIAADIRSCGFFCITADGTTDVSQHEQLSIILRYVSDDLKVSRVFGE